MDDISIVVCGEAGQGLQTMELVLTRVLKLAGYHVFATKEYMSRVRGGMNSTEVRVGSERVDAFVKRIDLLLPLNEGGIRHVADRVSSETIVLGERESIGEDERGLVSKWIELPFKKIAADIGNVIYSNLVIAGAILGLLGVEDEVVGDYLRSHFARKGEDIIRQNLEAARRGSEIGRSLLRAGEVNIHVARGREVESEILIDGSEAVAMGAIAGGCNFLSFYPMTPGTGVATFLAQHSEEFDIIVEQSEDEISAMNMAIGAWYGGARGMVTTSGGGFALMVEALSLAGMIESPLVVHLGQRPGPATGLATRTEQGDLLFTLFAGHGEFPRVVYAPGTLEDAFFLTAKAFSVADKYQVPAIILTDEYLTDSYHNIPQLDLSSLEIQPSVVRTEEEYRRYRFTEGGVSPRGIPSFGSGLISVSSDEHDEQGHITEDRELRRKMVEKRLRKGSLIEGVVVPPELIGKQNYRTLVIGWGSTRNVVVEALQDLSRTDVSFLHFKQVHPLHPETKKYILAAEKAIVVENNATAQFGQYLKLCTGIDIQGKVLKYDGHPFSKEEVAEGLMRDMEG